MVVDPFMCGIGGMGTLQYFNSQESLHGMIDFHSRAGAKVSPTMWEQDLLGRSEVNGYSMFADYRSELDTHQYDPRGCLWILGNSQKAMQLGLARPTGARY